MSAAMAPEGAAPVSFLEAITAHVLENREATQARVRLRLERSGECWVWTGAMSNGAPRMDVGGRTATVRVVTWLLAYGDVGAGEVRYVCGTRGCVCPGHLTRGGKTGPDWKTRERASATGFTPEQRAERSRIGRAFVAGRRIATR